MAGSEKTKGLVPEYHIKVNGNDLPNEALSDVQGVQVYEDVDAPSMFTLDMVNWNMEKLEISWADDDLFLEGNEVEIQMGYVGNLEIIFNGEITGLEPIFAKGDPPKLIVRGYDRRHRLLRGEKTKTFLEMKDSDIAGQIAQDAGLAADVEDTSVTFEYLIQHNQTDMGFLLYRAGRIGYEVIVQEKTLVFRKRKQDDGSVLTLKRDEDLIEFSPRLTTMGLVGKVKVQGWNPIDKERISGEAGAGDESTTMGGDFTGAQIVDEVFAEALMVSVLNPVRAKEEADQIAAGYLNESSLDFITGDGMCIGRPDLRAGTVITMEGLGKRFSGDYYLTSTIHAYSSKSGYETSFKVRRNAS